MRLASGVSRAALAVACLSASMAAAACGGGGHANASAAIAVRRVQSASDAPAHLPLAPLASLGKLTAAPSPGSPGPEGVPVPATKYVLAPPQTVKLGETIDGVTCQRLERFVYHIHVHLTLFLEGKAIAIPYGIGIGTPLQGVKTPDGPFIEAGTCFMWLHTHALDGVIHIESPTRRTYVLGQFFAVWGQALSATRVGAAKGKVTTFYDGKVWTGSPAAIPLTSETQIQLDVGSPIVAPEHIVFPAGLAGSCESAAGKPAPC